MSICFKGKTVIITGASSGIGQGLAVEYAKYGANLVLSGRNTDQLLETKHQCMKAGLKENQIVYISGDIAEEHIQKQLLDEAIDTFHQVDVLVNNAGIYIGASILEPKMDDFDKVHNVNLRAAVSLSLMTLPHLIKTKGNIVNVSSVGAWRPISGALYYSMSKAGMDMLTKSLAFEVATQGVRVNSVNAGLIPTNITRNTPQTEAEKNQMHDMLGKVMHPVGRCGEIKEVVDAIIFLSSERSTFITGHLLAVDGGCALGGISLYKNEILS